MTENKRESFVFYSSFDETLREMSEKDELEARRAICDYAFRGIEPDKTNIIVRIFFKSVKPLLDKSYQNYLNGKNGGRPKKTESKPNGNRIETERKPNQNPDETESKPNENQNETEPKPNQNRTETPLSNDKDNDKDKDKDFYKDFNSSIPPCIPPLKEGNEKTEEKNPEKKTRFVKPTIEEIDAYCKERKNGIDAEEFFYFYESRGWKIGKNPMKNWKAAVITWEKHDEADAEKTGRKSRKEIERDKEIWRRWMSTPTKQGTIKQEKIKPDTLQAEDKTETPAPQEKTPQEKTPPKADLIDERQQSKLNGILNNLFTAKKAAANDIPF